MLNYNLTMKRLFLSLLLIVTLSNADTSHTHLPYETTIALLKSIQGEAIVLGTGKTDVYVFVDPLCPHSRKFITMVSRNEAMLSKYRYYIYLYSIPRLKSEDVVLAIYASKSPADTLLQVMVKRETIETCPDRAGERIVSDIAGVAEKLDVYKRPYLIVAAEQ